MEWEDYFGPQDTDIQYDREEMYQAFKARLVEEFDMTEAYFEPNPLVVEEEEEEPEDPMDRHVRVEGYRQAHYAKKGWKFTARPFGYHDKLGNIMIRPKVEFICDCDSCSVFLEGEPNESKGDLAKRARTDGWKVTARNATCPWCIENDK